MSQYINYPLKTDWEKGKWVLVRLLKAHSYHTPILVRMSQGMDDWLTQVLRLSLSIFMLMPFPAYLPIRCKCKHVFKHKFYKLMVYEAPHRIPSQARRKPSLSAPWNYVYKHVYIYFLADRQAKAVGSLESGNLMVYGPLHRWRGPARGLSVY